MMEDVRKKKHTDSKKARKLGFIVMGVVLLAALIAVGVVDNSYDLDDLAVVDTSVILCQCESADVHSITLRAGDEEPWSLAPNESGVLTVQGENGFPLGDTDNELLLSAAATIRATNVLSEDPAEYAEHLADFGLETPAYEAWLTYADGTMLHLSVGDAAADETWYYMLLEGDERLFTFSRGAVEGLFVDLATLRQVTQPTLHKARIDRITLTGPEGMQAQWTLQTAITAADAIDNWAITEPFVYPAGSDAMTSLLSNAANLRLGGYVCEATPENLSLCGFDTPRLTIDIHMAAGVIGSVNQEGVYETADWPESTLTYVIGGEKSDMVDYVLYDGSIYIASHFTMGVFVDFDPRSTMSRYPVPTALGNLASLVIEENGLRTEYLVTRTEQVAENNDLVYDEDGNLVYDITLTRNGEAADYAAFEAAYNALTLVTVSGALPTGSETAAAPHTVYTFTDVDGTVHTVALATFDALHDAVIIDGHQAFYLIKGGFKLDME